METIDRFFDQQPIIALFLTISLGYVAGKFRVGRFVLGGIAGTLLVGVAVGQFDIKLDSGIKNIFFALFIYAVGFQGGSQLFRAVTGGYRSSLSAPRSLGLRGSASRL